MTLEKNAPGRASTGNVKFSFVPALADPFAPKVTELTAPTVKDITYATMGDSGVDHQTTVNKGTRTRFTSPQVGEFEDTIQDTVVVNYPYTWTEADIARLAFAKGITGFLVKRTGYANALDYEEDQYVTVIPIECGTPTDVAPTGNSGGGELGKTQNLMVTDTVARDVQIVA